MTEQEITALIAEYVEPNAVGVDRSGAFPTVAIDGLQAAGVLALTVAEEHGGSGGGLSAATDVVRRLAGACASTAMIVTMHYAAVAVLAVTGCDDVLSEIGERRHLTTLAFSEVGSRSHFWAPVSTASADGDAVKLNAAKSWVTSAHEASSFVWSSRPLNAEGSMSLWLVRTNTEGLTIADRFDGVGLRGNDSCPVTASNALVARSDLLGDDGAGLDLALSSALPWFLLLNASVSVGLMQAMVQETVAHLVGSRLEHLDQTLAQQLPARSALARMQIETDRTRALVDDAVTAVESGRADAQLLVLEVKAAAAESAAYVANLAMATGGGAAFRKESGVERRARDATAARVMAPTTDALLDFVGRALCGLPLLDA
jgi:isovaleryl-CoA dehydrogenase